MGFIAPGLVADPILSADGFYAILFALFEYRQLFFLGETRTALWHELRLVRDKTLYHLTPKAGGEGPGSSKFVAIVIIVLANGARLRAATQTVVSPSISDAKRASNAVSLVVVGVADGELIVGVGVDREFCVDPYRQAAAKLHHGGPTLQRRAAPPRKDGVGISLPIPPEIGPEIRLPDLTTRSHDRPFGPQPDPPARPLRVAERDFAKPVISIAEGDFLP